MTSCLSARTQHGAARFLVWLPIVAVLEWAPLAHAAPHAESDDAQITISVNTEFRLARRDFLTAETDDDRKRLFAEMSDSWTRCIPIEYSSLDEPIAILVREFLFRDVRQMPRCLEYMRDIIRHPVGHSSGDLSLVAGVLADKPEKEDLEALLSGLRACDPSSPAYPTIGRHLGRATAARLKAGDARDSTVVASVLEALNIRLNAKTSYERAAAIDGLFRAGEQAVAYDHLNQALFDDRAERVESLRIMAAIRRLFKKPEFDSRYVERTLEIARIEADELLATGGPKERSVLPGVSTASRMFAAIVNIMRVAAEQIDVDRLVGFYTSDLIRPLMSMDAMQNLRLTLQDLREGMDSDRRLEVDRVFFEPLIDAGEKLFSLEEVPWTPEQKRAFSADRNQRYNAAAYFASQWTDEEDVRILWEEEGSAGDLLSLIARAEQDVLEEDGYVSVMEKLENRVLCARILTKLVVSEYAEADFDLEDYFVRYMCTELGSPYDEVIGAFRALQKFPIPQLTVEVPQVTKPFDIFVRNSAAIGLGDLGWGVFITESGLEIKTK